MKDFSFFMPSNIVFGAGKVRSLKRFIPTNVDRILIVTDPIVYDKCDIPRFIKNTLSQFTCFVYKEIEENPSFETIEKASHFAWENKIELIIGFGGGSPMDAAKGVAAFCRNSKPVLAYMNGESLHNEPLPIIQIPTTSGTGSEVTPYAIYTDTEAGLKKCFSHPKVFARTAIIDPELTYSMPDNVTRNTGMDVLCHAIEAYLSLDTFDLNDVYALESIKIVIENLPKAIAKDKDGMDAMAYASAMAGVSITHASTILLHIMAYPLTIHYGLPHGLANSVLLPTFMDFMRRSSASKEKIRKIDDLFEKVGGVRSFIESLGVQTKLSEHGINNEEFLKYANETIVKDDVKITPAKIDLQTIHHIYHSAY